MKLCGCKEKCFKNGECWGHYEGVMCKYLGEKDFGDEIKSICSKTGKEVLLYTTDVEHKSALEEINKN